MSFRRKRRKVKKSDYRRFRDRPVSYLIETAACLALLGILGWGFVQFIRNEPSLHVQSIRVEGAEMLDEQAVIQQAGVTSDDCIFFVNPWDIRRRLEQMPFIHGCEIERLFPDRLIIRIRERVALATLVINNRLFELDREGNVLRELRAAEQHVGPLITEPAAVDAVEVGTKLTAPAVLGALNVWRAFCRTEMARHVTVSEICAAQESRICLYCDEIKPEIRWGRSNFEKQAWKLNTLWSARKGRIMSEEYIDLRFGEDIACK